MKKKSYDNPHVFARFLISSLDVSGMTITEDSQHILDDVALFITKASDNLQCAFRGNKIPEPISPEIPAVKPKTNMRGHKLPADPIASNVKQCVTAVLYESDDLWKTNVVKENIHTIFTERTRQAGLQQNCVISLVKKYYHAKNDQ